MSFPVAASFSLVDSTPALQGVFFLHYTATVFMTGLIWFVQIVHYPLFRTISQVEFAEYHRRHMSSTGAVVVFPMLIEIVSVAALVLMEPNLLANPLFLGSLILLAVVWISTGFLQVPAHRSLRRDGNGRSAIRSLLFGNWFRTIAWSGRTCLLGTIIMRGVVP